jgi:pyruvate/2-oxoglutarate/acetoin dehydrogenase E1 component
MVAQKKQSPKRPCCTSLAPGPFSVNRGVASCFQALDAPVRRLAARDCPVAYCPELEEAILPQSGDVLRQIRELAAY